MSEAGPSSAAVVKRRAGQVAIKPCEGSSSSSSGMHLVPRPTPPVPAPLAPKATHSHRGARILSEEAYISSLSRIIQRDFFPDLARLQAENEYLSALEGGQDDERIRRAVKKLVKVEEKLGIIPPTPRRSRKGKEREGFFGSNATPKWDEATPRSARGAATPMSSLGEWDATPVHQSTDPAATASEEFLYSEEEDEEALGGEGMDAPSSELLSGLSLSAFEQNFTSLDNASFGSLLAKVNQERRSKYAWAFMEEDKARIKWQQGRESDSAAAGRGERLAILAAEDASKDGNTRAIEGSQRLSIAAAPDQAEGQSSSALTSAVKAAGLSDAKPVELPEEVTLAGPLDTALGTRSQSKPSWLYKARNSLMFPPDSDRSTLNSRSSSLPQPQASSGSISSQDSLYSSYLSGGEDAMRKLGEEKPSINFGNVRLPEAGGEGDAQSSAGAQTPRSSVLNAAIEGKRRPAHSSSSSVASLDTMAGSTTPRIRGHAFVSPLPTPRPGDLGEERMRQLMTWGSIVRTPVVIRGDGDPADDSGAATPDTAYVNRGGFSMPPTSRRDELLRDLTSKSSLNSKALYSTRIAAGSRATPSARSAKRDASMLSPAAQHLLDRTAGGLTPRTLSRGTSSLGARLIGKRTGVGQTSSVGATRTAPRAESEEQGRLKRRRWSPSPSPVVQRSS